MSRLQVGLYLVWLLAVARGERAVDWRVSCETVALDQLSWEETALSFRVGKPSSRSATID